MTTPQGPRDPMRDSRGQGRGRDRGSIQTRDSRGDGRGEPPFRGSRTATNSNSSNPTSSQPTEPLPRQIGTHTRSLRGRKAPSSVPRGQAGVPLRSSRNLDSGSLKEGWRNAMVEPSGSSQKRMGELFLTLRSKREMERKNAMKKGFLADPDRPTSLKNAITPVGTCQDMCAEFERVERIVQLNIDKCEKTTSELGDKVPCEERMVKRFRRSAAGNDEQLPSDIRPPLVLQKTLNYLFDEVIGGSQPLAAVHKFVWDRTRAIRNDFSIQQLTKVADLRVAVDCLERIARFHILSLHQLSRSGTGDGDFDSYQEREQLNNTLLSLMYYYEDSRHKMIFPNEAEFRAYCIILEIQDHRPDLEDRAQLWPRPLLQDRRVQTALSLYAATGSTSDGQGPLRPPARFSVAQAYTGRFWALVKSNAVPYLMACVAEIYFGLVRSTALETIWKAYKGKRGGPTKMEDWVLGDLKIALGFDDDTQTEAFCEDFGFTIAEKDTGEPYIDLGSVGGRYLEDTNPRRKQIFSETLVEQKRLGRTLTAVINGLSASQARLQGLIDHSSSVETSSTFDNEPLFIGDSEEEQTRDRTLSTTLGEQDTTKSDPSKLNPSASPFNLTPTPFNPSTSSGFSFASTGSFGMPSAPSTAKPPTGFSSIFKPETSTTDKPNPFGTQQTPALKFPTIANTSKQTNDSFTPSVTNGPTLQQKDVFKQPPAFSFGTSPLFANIDKSNDSKGSPQEKSATSTDSIPIPAISILSDPATQESSPTPPVPTLFQSPSSASTLFPPSTTASTIFSTSTPKPSMFPPSKASESPSAPPLTKSSSPFSKFLPSAGTPTFPTQGDSSKTTPPTLAPFSPKNTSRETFTNFPPNSQPFLFPTSAVPTLNQSAISQPVTPFSPMDTSASHSQITSAAVPSPFSPNVPRSPFTPMLSPTEQARARPPQSDPRPAVLDQLSQAMVMDDEGLLKQFVEYTIGPIIAASFRQVKDERSWTKAREARTVLLGKKYFKKWKANAWKRGLLRKGTERRKTFAASMRELAQSTGNRRFEPSSSSQSAELGQGSQRDTHGQSTMPPPSVPTHKRTSLPSDFGGHSDASDTPSNKKQNHHHSPPQAEQGTPKSYKASHKRSSTVAGLSMSHPSRKRTRSPEWSRLGYSTLANGTIIDDKLMKKARHLVGRARTDTTNTDYFLLKSRGIDPDTPIVPETKKRRSITLADDTPESNKVPKLSPPNSSNSPFTRLTNRGTPSQTPPTTITSQASTTTPQPTSTTTTTKTNSPDTDAALFASLASVRSALAESISWFQSERAKSEASSLAASTSPPAPPNETAKQKRLREFKFTPSRTEVRMRASGYGAVWDERERGRERDEEAWSRSQSQTPKETGNQDYRAEILNGQPQGQTGRTRLAAEGSFSKPESKASGSSVEDAIEL